MNKVISNAYPLSNKKFKDILHVSNLGLRAFWELYYGDIVPLTVKEYFEFTPNSEGCVPQLKRELFVQKNHTYFLSFEVHCLAHSSGKLGIGLGGSRNSLSVSEETHGFILKQQFFQFNETRTIPVYFGGMNQAKLTGTIRNVLMIDLGENNLL